MKRVPIYARIKLPSGKFTYRRAQGNGSAKRFKPVPEAIYYLRIEGKFQRVESSDPAVIIAAQKREEARLNAFATGAIERPKVEPKGATVKESITAFLGEKLRARKTQLAYTHALGLFAAFTDAQFPADITRKHILDFYQNLKGSTRTKNNLVLVLRVWMRTLGLTSPLKKGDLAKPVKKKPPVYQEWQVQALLQAATRDEHDLIAFLLQSGCREQEAQYAMYSDLMGDKWVVKQKAAYPQFTIKDREEREIPVPDSFTQMLRARQARYPDSKLVFPGKNGKPDGHLLRRIKSLALQAGLNCGDCIGKDGRTRCDKHPICSKYTLHSFRRTYASRLHAAGVPLLKIKEYLGHADIQTTEKYLGILHSGHEQETLNAAFASLTLQPVLQANRPTA